MFYFVKKITWYCNILLSNTTVLNVICRSLLRDRQRAVTRKALVLRTNVTIFIRVLRKQCQ